MAQIPIPRDTAQAFARAESGCRNLGLLFDHFIGYEAGWSLEGQSKHKAAEDLVRACNRWAEDPAHRRWHADFAARWRSVMESAGAEPFEARLASRLVVGLGRDSAFETGLTLHRVYGFPYIPGSALKGMTQAWATHTSKPPEQIDLVFGVQAQSGAAVFFDAFPAEPPQLKLDVLNPHYPEYYRPGERRPPADWQSPVPVYFITVESGVRFLFGVGYRTRPAGLPTVRSWLQDALNSLGVGGKTTSGYGSWTV